MLIRVIAMGRILMATVLVALQPMGAHAQSRLGAEQRREIVEAAADAYANNYVFEEKGRLIADGLRQQLAAGAFERYTEPATFARALTEAVRGIHPDRHIEIVAPERSPEPVRASAAQSRAEQLGWVERLRRRNYDFVRAEILPGNIGLLRLDSFPPPELAASTATAAMAFLQNADALIIDLRANGGGTGDMVQFLASYFFVEPTRLVRTFRRDGDPPVTYQSTLSSIPGQRLPIIDVYVLTSDDTISAAEAFAFALQQTGRAVIVGETTAGAGNAGNYLDIGHGFRAFVPDVAASSPTSDATWEGVGVTPDIRASADRALVVAHRAAVQRLLAAANEARTRDALTRALEATVQ
jgi:C-terminal processing protease CtpA/Prc